MKSVTVLITSTRSHPILKGARRPTHRPNKPTKAQMLAQIVANLSKRRTENG